ncbi:MAG: hypothetical protein QOD37_713 [Gaiellales bacterium]|nr:hypothetical protein [Gaiellales bacterium]
MQREAPRATGVAVVAFRVRPPRRLRAPSTA